MQTPQHVMSVTAGTHTPTAETRRELLTRVLLDRPRYGRGKADPKVQELKRRIRRGNIKIAAHLLALYEGRSASDARRLGLVLAGLLCPREGERDVVTALIREGEANEQADNAERRVLASPDSLCAIDAAIRHQEEHLLRVEDSLAAMRARREALIAETEAAK